MQTELCLFGLLMFVAPTPADEPSVLQIERPAEGTVGSERFALELDLPLEGSPSRVGVAELRRSNCGGESLLEWDLHFAFEGPRVLHVERLSARGAKLVWREFVDSRARTVLCEFDARTSALRVVDWNDERRREDLRVESKVLTPLALLELARRGEICDGPQTCFDPLSGALETLELATSSDGECDAGRGDRIVLRRRFELTRTDGTRAWSAEFRGDELLEFRWQGGGLAAKRIDEADYRTALEELDAANEPDRAAHRDV